MTLVKTFICTSVVLSLCFLGLSNAQTKSVEHSDASEVQELSCAEECAVDRDVERKQCEIIYDDSLCFGHLPCLDDTETARRQCENIANTIHFGCASRCYEKLLESKGD